MERGFELMDLDIGDDLPVICPGCDVRSVECPKCHKILYCPKCETCGACGYGKILYDKKTKV